MQLQIHTVPDITAVLQKSGKIISVFRFQPSVSFSVFGFRQKKKNYYFGASLITGLMEPIIVNT